MSRFTQKTSHRKERRPQASWLVLGLKRAPAVARGEITMHVTPAKGPDHRKRYAAGQRLAVKQVVGVPGMGDTLCNVRVLDVKGPGEQWTAGQVGFHEARLLGHRTTAEFRVWWIEEHDRDWLERHDDELAVDELLERFDRRWASKLVWMLRFTVDIAEAPRLLAASDETGGSFSKGPDGRWRYVERATDRETDRGYTATASRALSGEMAALSDADHDRHVAKRRDMTTQQWVDLGEATRAKERETRSVEERLQRIELDARARSVDISREMWLIRKRLPVVSAVSLEKQIAAVEARVYRVAA